MSVLMLLRVQGNAKELEVFAHENPEAIQQIAEKSKAHGVLRHRFFGTDSEIYVVDEWPSAEAFQRFYGESPEIGAMMAKIGVTAEPSITFAPLLETGDEVG
jgi:hypothetical protein